MYDKAIYEYIKNGKKYYDNKMLKYTYGYYKLDNLKKMVFQKLLYQNYQKN